MNSVLTNVSVRQLKRAITIREKIESLEGELNQLFGSQFGSIPSTGHGRRKVSAAGRARMAAAQKARWAKRKAVAISGNKPRRKMSAAGRAKIAAAARARWKKAKAAGKNRL